MSRERLYLPITHEDLLDAQSRKSSLQQRGSKPRHTAPLATPWIQAAGAARWTAGVVGGKGARSPGPTTPGIRLTTHPDMTLPDLMQ